MDDRLAMVHQKEQDVKDIQKFISKLSVTPDEFNGYLSSIGSATLSQKVKAQSILSRPHISLRQMEKVHTGLKDFLQKYTEETIHLAETTIKYAGYILKEKEMVDKMNRLEEVFLKDDFDYHEVQALSSEAREKLTKIKPRTIGQASRISGVSPSDISVLLVKVGR